MLCKAHAILPYFACTKPNWSKSGRIHEQLIRQLWLSCPVELGIYHQFAGYLLNPLSSPVAAVHQTTS